MTAPAGRLGTSRTRPDSRVAPRLQLVPTPRLRPPRAPFVTLVVGLLGGGLVALLMLNTAIAQNSFGLHELQQRTAALNLQEQALQREIDDLEAPAALAVSARRMGMVPAGNPAFIRLPEGTILGVPTVAKAPPPPPAPRPAPTPSASALLRPSTAGAPSPAVSPAASAAVRR